MAVRSSTQYNKTERSSVVSLANARSDAPLPELGRVPARREQSVRSLQLLLTAPAPLQIQLHLLVHHLKLSLYRVQVAVTAAL